MKKKPKKKLYYSVFTPTEEKVVSFLKFKKSGASISEISRGLKLARTSIYNAIDSLIQKKTLKKEKFKYFLIKIDLIRNNVRDAGKKINNLLIEMSDLKKGEIIYSIESDEEIEHLFKKEAGVIKWQKTVADKGIVLKGVGSTKALALFRNIKNIALEAEIKRRSGSARFTAESLLGPCVLVSFHNSVVFFSRKNKYFYRIDNANVAKFIQTVIEALYLNLRYEPFF